MPSINDWAARAAERIADEPILKKRDKQWEERVAAIIATFAAPILKLLEESRHVHYECTREGDEENTTPDDCTCGADEWNKKIDEALR